MYILAKTLYNIIMPVSSVSVAPRARRWNHLRFFVLILNLRIRSKFRLRLSTRRAVIYPCREYISLLQQLANKLNDKPHELPRIYILLYTAVLCKMRACTPCKLLRFTFKLSSLYDKAKYDNEPPRTHLRLYRIF